MFHIPPRHVEPAAGQAGAVLPAGAAAVSPPTQTSSPGRGPGICACGCRGGITHYTLPPRWGWQGVRRGHPGPRKAERKESAVATNHCGRCRYVTNTISYRSVPMLPGWQPPFRVGIGVGGRHLTWADCSFVPPPDHIFSLLGKCIGWRPSAQTSPAHTP